MVSAEFDYTDCKYNPRKTSFVQTIEKAIPAFKKYDGATGALRHNTFGYVVAMFDKNSPLLPAVPEYFQRKIKAATTCGLKNGTTGGFSRPSMAIMEGQDKAVNALIVAYIADLGDMDYLMLINEITMYHSMTQAVLGGSVDGKLYQTLQLLNDNIRQRTRMVFGSGAKDELQNARIALYESAEKDRRKLNPEAVVSLLDENGEFPQDWSRFGKEYMPDELKLHQDVD